MLTALLILLAVAFLVWLGPVGILILLTLLLTLMFAMTDWFWQFITAGWPLLLLCIPLAILIYHAQRDLGDPPFGSVR